MLAHEFNGPPFTVGVEEELMILHADGFDLAQEVGAILAEVPDDVEGHVKPELFQSVLEVATLPCQTVAEAGEQLRQLRRTVSGIAERRGLVLAAAGTHPFGRWEDQKVVELPRYQELADELGYVAAQELIFGTHVHVAIKDPDRAIYVADGIRQYLPLMLALSSNSPFWHGDATGMMSARTPVFRAFPRVGIPPHYGTWEIYSHRMELMMRSGAIEDYTYVWWDVRPHPNLGTVETRVFDQQTRIEHTEALAALTLALSRRMSSLYDDGAPLVEYPTELIDDNKVRAALWGMEGNLIDFRRVEQSPAIEMLERLLDELGEHAQDLGCASEIEGVRDLIENGTGARRQMVLHERTGDLVALAGEMVEASRA